MACENKATGRSFCLLGAARSLPPACDLSVYLPCLPACPVSQLLPPYPLFFPQSRRPFATQHVGGESDGAASGISWMMMGEEEDEEEEEKEGGGEDTEDTEEEMCCLPAFLPSV
ncbi:hypothetical protein B0O80DRAFT_445015 [Mortierella sp. GBAus27b]|nr:hypothetical protein B0O80DRAFT_445015 [Mortierella sp. GBAus27b]